MFKRLSTVVMCMLLFTAIMAFASPPSQNNTKIKANENVLMSDDSSMFAQPQTPMVLIDTATAMSPETSIAMSNNDDNERSANVAYEMQSDNRRCSSQYNTTMTATTTDDKEESSPPAVAATNFCSESFSYTTNMTAETAPTTLTSTQMGHLATEGDFPLKFI